VAPPAATIAHMHGPRVRTWLVRRRVSTRFYAAMRYPLSSSAAVHSVPLHRRRRVSTPIVCHPLPPLSALPPPPTSRFPCTNRKGRGTGALMTDVPPPPPPPQLREFEVIYQNRQVWQ
jgi:hypothetical protein